MKQEHYKFTDKYFIRTKEILEKENLNPYVRAQVFIRKGPGVVAGMDEAIQFIDENSDLRINNGKVYALKNGDEYSPKETQMVIEGNLFDFVTLETCYLGIIASRTTKLNDNTDINLADITKKVNAVASRINGRDVLYFGARHWHYKDDASIAKAAFVGGATQASTDIGAQTFQKLGVGTIPHVLENVYAHKFGKDRAVVEATKAFDRHISKEVPRIALIDYNNKEIDDALACAKEVPSLVGVRVDTCGENVMQGAYTKEPENLKQVFGKDFKIEEQDKQFWFGPGVTISGVYALRKALNENGYENVNVVLTSGFGKIEKVDAFLRAEELLEMKLFDSIGAGTFFHSRAATMDVVGVYENNNWMPISKVGREYRPNARLELRLN